MGHPVTTNPFIIMLINMTVVFVVLVSLSFLINLIHLADPTKQPEVKEDEPEPEPEPAVSKLPAAPEPAPAPVIEEGIPAEVIVAISAAVACCGISGTVRAVRVVNNKNSAWRQNALASGLTNV